MSTPAAVVRTFRVLALAVAIAAPAEGLRQVAYRDPGGLPTACLGTTDNVRLGDQFSLQQCMAFLSRDMLEAIDTVERCAPGLPEHVLAAFADAVYNIGPRIACDKSSSTAARLLAMGEYLLACNELPRWNKTRVGGVMVALPGLTKRREMERQLCLSGLV